MRALWEQGFFGKGSLSRSEPNWLKRELVRRGDEAGYVSELMTAKRREERVQAKWERARLEQEAIRTTKLEEAQRAERRRQAALQSLAPKSNFVAPVGPMELLALPNSNASASLSSSSDYVDQSNDDISKPVLPSLPSLIEQLVGVSESRTHEIPTPLVPVHPSTASDISKATESDADTNKQLETPPSEASTSSDSGTKTIKRQKSVRFSPTVESTTFNFSDPPSPSASLRAKKPSNGDKVECTANGENGRNVDTVVVNDIVNKEHLQLTPEEAFFLAFGLGALRVADPYSGQYLGVREMLRLFRQHSYVPPRTGPDDPDLRPDDGFLVHYAVYHHFRSLGWVPRSGIKFAVDWLLYTRGPVFDHAEFGVIVLPSYSHAWWKANGRPKQDRNWQWLHSVVRVLSHATKSLVLVYVDVPPPTQFNQALESGFSEALKLYKVREVLVKRWSSNRNR